MDGNSYFINDGFGLCLGSSYLNLKYEYTVNKPIDEIFTNTLLAGKSVYYWLALDQCYPWHCMDNTKNFQLSKVRQWQKLNKLCAGMLPTICIMFSQASRICVVYLKVKVSTWKQRLFGAGLKPH